MLSFYYTKRTTCLKIMAIIKKSTSDRNQGTKGKFRFRPSNIVTEGTWNTFRFRRPSSIVIDRVRNERRHHDTIESKEVDIDSISRITNILKNKMKGTRVSTSLQTRIEGYIDDIERAMRSLDKFSNYTISGSREVGIRRYDSYQNIIVPLVVSFRCKKNGDNYECNISTKRSYGMFNVNDNFRLPFSKKLNHEERLRFNYMVRSTTCVNENLRHLGTYSLRISEKIVSGPEEPLSYIFTCNKNKRNDHYVMRNVLAHT